MSNRKKPLPPLSLLDLGKILVKHYGITEGKYEVSIEFRIGMGSIGPTPEDRLPGAMLGVSGIGIVPTDKEGPLVIDASKLDD